jgi:hypothetical protein
MTCPKAGAKTIEERTSPATMGMRRMIMLLFEAVRRQAYQIGANNRYDLATTSNRGASVNRQSLFFPDRRVAPRQP